MLYANVIIKKKTLTQELTYSVPASILPYIAVGRLVEVPIRHKKALALVVSLQKNVDKNLAPKLKEIIKINREVDYGKDFIDLLYKLAERYGASLAEIGNAMIRYKLNYPDSAQKGGKTVFLEGNWAKRQEVYLSLLKKHKTKSFLFIFAQKINKDEFAKKVANFIDTDKNIKELPSRFVAVGTASGVFYPLKSADYIIIDEPENPGLKMDFRPYLKVVEVAKVRSFISNLNLIIGDNLPSISVYKDIVDDKIKYFGSKIKPVDYLIVKQEMSPLTDTVIQEITDILAQKDSVLIVCRSKNWSNLAICQDCKELIACPNCQSNLMMISDGKYYCRTCRKCYILNVCPKCQSVRIKAIGFGIERVKAYATKLFGENAVDVMDEKIFYQPTKAYALTVFVDGDNFVGSSNEDGWRFIKYLKQLCSQRVIIQTRDLENKFWETLNNPTTYLNNYLETSQKYKLPPYGDTCQIIGLKPIQETEITDKIQAKIKGIYFEPLRFEYIFSSKRSVVALFKESKLTIADKNTIKSILPPSAHLNIDL